MALAALGALIVLSLATGGACQAAREPTWIDLSRRGFVRSGSGSREYSEGFGRPLRLEPGEQAGILAVPLRREEWQARSETLWSCRIGLQLERVSELWPNHGLRDEHRRFRPINPIPVLGQLDEGTFGDGEQEALLPFGVFLLGREMLYLKLEAGSEPATETILELVFPGSGAPGRVQGWRFSGDGIQLWPGEIVSWTLDIPPDSMLRFATAWEPLPVRTTAGELVFRVSLDGEELLADREDSSRQASARWHAVPLPREGRGSARLSFSVDGVPVRANFLAPIVGPVEVGCPGQRPWGADRPDVVLFVADTFRADNLEIYGGDPVLTPALNALARRARCHLQAWSVAPATLPAHASLFTGLFPGQAGISSRTSRVPDELVTLAECLAARGYRTGAITDSGFVSQGFGLDQGFAFFDESRSRLAATGERALGFLDADDGRPVFLFVHTYRAHRVYEVSAETRAALGQTLGLAGEAQEVEGELLELANSLGFAIEMPPDAPPEVGLAREAAPIVSQLRALYRGGVVDLDRGFGSFLAELEARGLFASGYLVFTSDHGEAFAEHGELYHSRTLFEEKTRIPLLLAGKGIQAGVVREPTSLIDLPATIAELCGIRPPAAWLGSSLFELPRERPIFSFEADQHDPDPTFAVIDGARKLIGLERPRVDQEPLFAAFDLARDPGESRDLARSGEAWPREMLQRFRPVIDSMLVPASVGDSAEISPDKLEELRALGYGVK
jgi:arylsulfatase A-like enzyme